MDHLVGELEPLTNRSLASAVADRIRDAIHDGSYPPGARLVERTLARRLGVSHIPVREALARLADEGLIERLPRRGARVAQLTPEALGEISSLRIVLEQLVVSRAQERLTPATEAELRGIARQMLAAGDAGDVEGLIALDQRFHLRLWELAEHSLLNELAAQVRGRIAAFLRAATRSLPPDELREHAQTHVALLDAIASGDPGLAEQQMARHIEMAAERVRLTLTARGEGGAGG
jgi:DNA-binding GntR family transcriptional regulator